MYLAHIFVVTFFLLNVLPHRDLWGYFISCGHNLKNHSHALKLVDDVDRGLTSWR